MTVHASNEPTYPHDRLLRFACAVAHADLDLARESNHYDRVGIINCAAILLLTSSLAWIVWTAFFATFSATIIAIILGLLMGGFIYLIDCTLTSSDWEPAGILRKQSHTAIWYGRLTLRLALALLFSLGTGTSAALWLSNAAIQTRLQQDRAEHNRPVRAEYEAQIGTLKTQLLDPIETDLKALENERNAASVQLQTVIKAHMDALQRAADANLDHQREIDGGLPGYVRGNGPRAKDAARRFDAANALLTSATAQIQSTQAVLADLQKQIASKTIQLQQGSQTFARQSASLRNDMLADPRWQPERTDPLLQVEALWAIETDPTSGPAARWYHVMLTLILVAMELTPVLTKSIFGAANVYQSRLKQRAEYEDEQVEIGYNELRAKRAPKLPQIDVGVDGEWPQATRIVEGSGDTQRRADGGSRNSPNGNAGSADVGTYWELHK